MPTSFIGSIAVNILAKTNRFSKGISDSRKGLNRFTGGLRKTIFSLKNFVGALAALAAGSALTRFISNIAKADDQTAKFAGRLGVATQELLELQFAAERSGVSTSNLQQGLQRLTRRMGEAASGTGEAVAAFERLNLDAAKLAQLPLTERLKLIATQLKTVGDRSQQLAVLFKLVDTEGVGLINLFDQGAEGIEKFRARFNELQGDLGKLDDSKAQGLADAFTDLRTALEGFGRRVLVAIGDDLVRLTTQAADFVAAFDFSRLNIGAGRFRGLLLEFANIGRSLIKIFNAMQLILLNLFKAAANIQATFSFGLVGLDFARELQFEIDKVEKRIEELGKKRGFDVTGFNFGGSGQAQQAGRNQQPGRLPIGGGVGRFRGSGFPGEAEAREEFRHRQMIAIQKAQLTRQNQQLAEARETKQRIDALPFFLIPGSS